ncbi:hypothetical protein ACN6MT_06290 [Neobacillus niacini]
MDYSNDVVHLLLKQFIEHYNLIRYNPKMRELAIRGWGNPKLQIYPAV